MIESVVLTVVVAVHDARVVEHHVHSAPLVHAVDDCLHVRFFGDVTLHDVDLADHVGSAFLGLGDRFLESRLRDVRHENGSSFTQEQDRGLEADATVVESAIGSSMGGPGFHHRNV